MTTCEGTIDALKPNKILKLCIICTKIVKYRNTCGLYISLSTEYQLLSKCETSESLWKSILPQPFKPSRPYLLPQFNSKRVSAKSSTP